MKIGFIQYNRSKLDWARENRNNPTLAENILWQKLLRKDRLNYRFLRQKVLSGFIADFYCSKLLLVIEVDGKIHDFQKEYDQDRTLVLNGLNLKVLRYSNDDVLNNIDLVEQDLKNQISLREKELFY